MESGGRHGGGRALTLALTREEGGNADGKRVNRSRTIFRSKPEYNSVS